jgi:hypothetical protein
MIKELEDFKKSALALSKKWIGLQEKGFSQEGAPNGYPFDSSFDEVAEQIEFWSDNLIGEIKMNLEVKYVLCLETLGILEEGHYYKMLTFKYDDEVLIEDEVSGQKIAIPYNSIKEKMLVITKAEYSTAKLMINYGEDTSAFTNTLIKINSPIIVSKHLKF